MAITTAMAKPTLIVTIPPKCPRLRIAWATEPHPRTWEQRKFKHQLCLTVEKSLQQEAPLHIFFHFYLGTVINNVVSKIFSYIMFEYQ